MFLKAIIVFIVCFIGISLFWRLLSTRHTLPCPSWLRWFVELDNPFAPVAKASNIVKHLHLHPEMSVLDVGCGPGRVSLPLAKKLTANGQLTALDIQQGMLSSLKSKAEKNQMTNIDYLCMNIAKTPLDKQFDRIVMVCVLGEILNQEQAFKHLANALKPGGLLSITEIIFDPHFQSRKKVIKLASDFGLIEQSFFGYRLAYTINFTKMSS